jgi:GT2 family glycosyltransferase
MLGIPQRLSAWWLQFRRERLISRSGYFDREWYLAQHPDVAESKVSPARHYLLHGSAEGRNPSERFDTSWYLAHYADVSATGTHPLVHYLERGRAEGRAPTPPNAARTVTSDRLPGGIEYGAACAAPEFADLRIAVFTAIAGGYDLLRTPLVVPRNCDFFVYSDALVGDPVWQWRPLPCSHSEPVRSARFVKLHPHLLLHDYDIAIWVDANIQLVGNVTEFLTSVTPDHLLVTWRHPFRSSVREEALECLSLDKADSTEVDAQLDRYDQAGFPDDEGLYETRVLVTRPQEPRTRRLMTAWWAEIARGTHRDQISLPFAAWRTGENIGVFEGTVQDDARLQLLHHAHVRGPRVAQPAFFPTPAAPVRPVVTAEIGVCVHNSLDDVRRCLESVASVLREGVTLAVVDDGSDAETAAYLEAFVTRTPSASLHRNPKAQGYTYAANVVLRNVTTDYVVLLNSDAVITPRFIDKVVGHGERCAEIGIIGPLSNAASWQTIPELLDDHGHFKINELPPSMTVERLDNLVETLLPPDPIVVPLVNGFCLAIKRNVIDTIGVFDEDAFPHGYGEEDDLCFRAQDAGFLCCLAANCYTFRAKSKSYGKARRDELTAAGGQALRRKHGSRRIARAVSTMRQHERLRAIRADLKGALADLGDERDPR